MVGVKRSTGCRLCVKRRVRCGEERPSCLRCVKYGAECPGYTRELKFLGSKHGETPSASRRPGHNSPSATSAVGSEGPGLELGLSRGQRLLPLVQDLLSLRNAEEFAHFLPWFKGFPERVGSKVTLDGALLAFALHLRGKASRDNSLVAQARQTYVQTLGVLQMALNHPVEWRSSETLACAILLCFYESFAGTTSSTSWMGHASGVGKLMQLRGAEAHETEWDAAMLRAFRGLTIMYALFTFQDCFLAAREWRKVLHDAEGGIQSILAEEFWCCMSLIPGLVRQARELRSSSQIGLVNPYDVLELCQQANQLRGRLLAWHGTLSRYIPPTEEAPSRDINPPYPTINTFYSVWVGALHMGFWASLLIIQTMLNEWEDSAGYVEHNKELFENILRSVEYTSQGLMGPYRVGYSVRVAAEFADPATREWLAGVLRGRLGEFAATTPLRADVFRPLVAHLKR